MPTLKLKIIIIILPTDLPDIIPLTACPTKIKFPWPNQAAIKLQHCMHQHYI